MMMLIEKICWCQQQIQIQNLRDGNSYTICGLTIFDFECSVSKQRSQPRSQLEKSLVVQV